MVRIPAFHAGGPGSIPGVGTPSDIWIRAGVKDWTVGRFAIHVGYLAMTNSDDDCDGSSLGPTLRRSQSVCLIRKSRVIN